MHAILSSFFLSPKGQSGSYCRVLELKDESSRHNTLALGKIGLGTKGNGAAGRRGQRQESREANHGYYRTDKEIFNSAPLIEGKEVKDEKQKIASYKKRADTRCLY